VMFHLRISGIASAAIAPMSRKLNPYSTEAATPTSLLAPIMANPAARAPSRTQALGSGGYGLIVSQALISPI